MEGVVAFRPLMRPGRTTMSRRAPAAVHLGILFAMSVTGCGGGDSPTGPGAGARGAEFPTISTALAATWCVRGSLRVPGRRNGSITPADCIAAGTATVLSVPVGAGPDSYFETWRLRVPEGNILTLSVSSDFDSFLDVYRVPNVADPSTAAWVDSDDDGNLLQGLDAELEVTVLQGVEYWVMVSGFDSTEMGPYDITASLSP